MKLHARATVGILCAVVALAAAFLWWRSAPNGEAPSASRADAPANGGEAAAAWRKTSRAGPAEIAEAGAAAEAPPAFAGAAMPGQGPTPPPGYTFAARHGGMAKAKAPPGAVEPAPGAEFEWLTGGDGVADLARQAEAAGRDWTFGWVGIASDADSESLAARLRRHGADVLDRSRNMLRARLPGDAERLAAIAALPDIAGIAAFPAERKVHPALADHASAGQDPVAALVTLMDDDPDGRWGRALASLGAEVGAFDPAVRVYAANVPRDALAALAAMDFVLAVEPSRVFRPTHASAVPAMGADAVRVYDAATADFTGTAGAAVPVGVMDTGLNARHAAIASGRASICGANFVAGATGRDENRDLWVDLNGHGTHVTGTILGNGAVRPALAGMAPRVQDVRFAKVLSREGGGDSASVSRGMDFLARATGCGGAPARKPLIVNMSLAADSVAWDGKSADERKLDAVVWAHRQLYVVAQSNSGYQAYGNYGSAKNSLSVGAAHDRGDIAGFSSIGPTADGRLAPQVVGTGVNVTSARGNGSRRGYVSFSGTSMASPAVAGVAALLMDAVPGLREQPAAVRARLMASAVKPDAFLDDAARFPSDNSDGPGALQARYGLGKVSARTAVLARDDALGWRSGSAVVELGDGEYAYHDIEVPEDASRLDVVMTWDERPADTFAGTLLNDLDLWVDVGADCAGDDAAACGEGASLSTRDNVEWLVLRDPEPGTYRLKVVSKYSRVAAPRAALAWTVIRGASTPQLAVSTDVAAIEPAADAPFEIEATVTADAYVAAGAMLRVDCRGEEGSAVCERVQLIGAKASIVEREDGVTRRVASATGAIALGEVAVGERQRVNLVFKGVPADRFRLFFTASAWNAHGATTSVDVRVDRSEIAAAADVALPANDDFADAMSLSSATGATTFDLLTATPEPGEPRLVGGLTDEAGRFQDSARPRSVWIRFTAPADADYGFTIVKSGVGDLADDIQFDLFEDDAALAGLVTKARKTGGGLTFAARAGGVYHIRLSVDEAKLFVRPPAFFGAAFFGEGDPIARRPVRPMTLRWQAAPRPANDDFADAADLAGPSGEFRGNNQGATLQAGEYLGAMAASAWHRWRAPAEFEGRMEFQLGRRYLNVAVFSGDELAGLRLVSGAPGAKAIFPARAGAEYFVAVAADDASVSGTEYTLEWQATGRPGTGSDDILDAVRLAGERSSEHTADVDFANASVQPFEPAESGSRTAWFIWQAPDSGRYVWRLFQPVAGMQLAAFKPGAVAGEDGPRMTLTPVGVSDADRTGQVLMAFDAVADLEYRLSVGLDAHSAFEPLSLASAMMRWGLVPANDSFAAAVAISGATGSVSGTTANATLDAGEFAPGLGDSSVWWRWEAPESEWFRFALSGVDRNAVVAVYEMRGDGLGDLVLVASGRRLVDSVAVFKAKAGTRYAIRVGLRAPIDSSVDHDGTNVGEDPNAAAFTLAWDKSGAPAQLRFVGALADGDLDADGEFVELSDVGDAALNGDGDELYLASAQGLAVYSRTAASGDLALAQRRGGADNQSLLFWDAATTSLIAGGCSGWHRYAAGEEALAAPVAIGGATPCRGAFFRDSSGAFLYIVRPQTGIDAYKFDAERANLELVEMLAVEGMRAAAIGGDGGHVYAATSARGLEVYSRAADTGRLTYVASVAQSDGDDGGGDGENGGDDDQAASGDLRKLSALAVDGSGRYLFGTDQESNAVALDLDDADAPTTIGWQRSFVRRTDPFGPLPGEGAGCFFADVRSAGLAADFFCADAAFIVRLLPAATSVRPEDFLASLGTDSFGNEVPTFNLLRAAASPDGRHVYAVEAKRLLVFERYDGS